MVRYLFFILCFALTTGVLAQAMGQTPVDSLKQDEPCPCLNDHPISAYFLIGALNGRIGPSSPYQLSLNTEVGLDYRWDKNKYIGLSTGIDIMQQGFLVNPYLLNFSQKLNARYVRPFYQLGIGYSMAMNSDAVFNDWVQSQTRGGFSWQAVAGLEIPLKSASFVIKTGFRQHNIEHSHENTFWNQSHTVSKIMINRWLISTGLRF